MGMLAPDKHHKNVVTSKAVLRESKTVIQKF